MDLQRLCRHLNDVSRPSLAQDGCEFILARRCLKSLNHPDPKANLSAWQQRWIKSFASPI